MKLHTREILKLSFLEETRGGLRHAIGFLPSKKHIPYACPQDVYARGYPQSKRVCGDGKKVCLDEYMTAHGEYRLGSIG